MAAALRMIHERDPREALMERTKAFADRVKPLGARVLLATYMRPEKTAGGIIVPEKSRDEDSFQGKVGLIVGLGPLAFKDDDTHTWGDLRPAIGDWVLVNIGDTRRLQVADNPCRFVEDVHIQAVVNEPDLAW